MYMDVAKPSDNHPQKYKVSSMSMGQDRDREMNNFASNIASLECIHNETSGWVKRVANQHKPPSRFLIMSE